MSLQPELTAQIEVKGIETTPTKYINFRRQLINLCLNTFDDGHYISKNIIESLDSSLNTRDRALIDYALCESQNQFSLRQQSLLKRDR